MEKKTERYDVVIIGGGAAGLTAGIYCGRARLKTLLIEKSLVGGLATYTNEIENYPGFPQGQSGLDLMNLFHQQAKKFGVKFKLTDVKSVSLEGDTKVVETFRNRYECSAVIIASGGKPRLTGAKNEEKYLYDKGISFCATCDAAANTGKTVVVIGSGDAAIEEGMFLTKFADKVLVSVMHDVGIMDCNEIAKGQAMDNPKMEFLWNTVPDSFEGDDHLEGVVLKNLKTGQLEPIAADTCFLFIGYLPNTELFQDILDMSPSKYLKTNERMETNIPGVWAVGDVRDKFLKQVATAVGDGAVAGYGAEKYIAESEMFESQILRAEKPALVYLFSAVDPDARELLTYIEQLEEEISPRLSVAKVDIYKSDGIARRLGINRFPAVALVENGRIVKTMTEHVNEGSIREFIG
ncbi:FAD-dependent oxidoreductase [Ihubacter massiliensis]|uniref:FAD-dependent oxidoreductase n=1 Tax=Hominibacterium faecale TaxID=2839743 RepID=A0A9J6QUI9_9FIRM|nr:MULTISPECIES: FAD-dependent oxidoreductase [Eubacteriales Family XIII. Incertae Sedis]MCO7121539.1 FAD-dependent oxidoreductase [Ihubacter massiliensis]MCU7378519.1 FAD-dependent oxidoreductase [Hominibacterium faecale]